MQTVFSTSVDVVGVRFRRASTIDSDGVLIKNPSLAAAKAGTLTTRTSNTQGTLTLGSGHGVTDSARLDVYWTNDDGTQGRRYGMVVGTVSGTSVPLTSSGGGDNLPAAATAVTVMVPQLETFVVTAADLKALCVGCAAGATAVFRESDTTLVLAAEADGATGSYVWDSSSGMTNPFGDNVADVYLSHADSTSAQVVTVVAAIN